MSIKQQQPVPKTTNNELNKIANSEKGNKDAMIHHKIDGIGYLYIVCCIVRYGLFAEYGIPYSDQALVESNQIVTYSGGGLEIYDEPSACPNKLKDLFSKKNHNPSSKTYEGDEIYDDVMDEDEQDTTVNDYTD